VPADIEPPELARVVAFAERPRAGDWSLRSALCRYAQPEPHRVGQVLELVRRVEAALHPLLAEVGRDGRELWAALAAGGEGDTGDGGLLGLLAAAARLDHLGDTLAAWAVDRHGKHPEADVDATVADVERRLDGLGIPREERVPPPRARARG
jgi:hypothetical protein